MADHDINTRIRVTKTGTGAQDTIKELNQLAQSATRAGAVASSSVTKIGSDFKSLSSSLRGMDLFGAMPGQLGTSLSRMQGMLNTFASMSSKTLAGAGRGGGTGDMFANVANMGSFDESIAALNAGLEGTASQGAAAASSMALLGPALIVGGVAAVGAAVAVGKLAYSLGTAGQAVVQTQKKFIAFTGGPQQAADALQAMSSATEGGMSSMDAMTYSAMLLSMGLARNGEEAANVSRMALMLGPAYRDASSNIQDFTMMLANQSVRRLDQFGLSIDAVKRKQAELVAGGMDKQLAFTNAVLDIGAQKMRQLEAAGVVAGTGIQQLTSAWADLRAEMGKELAPAVGTFQSGLAQNLAELTNTIRSNSGDAATQLMGLQARIAAVRADYQTMLASGADPGNSIYLQQYANTLAELESRLVTARLAASAFGEAAGIAAVRAADGLTYTASAADEAAAAMTALDEAVQALRDAATTAEINTQAQRIYNEELWAGRRAALGFYDALALSQGMSYGATALPYTLPQRTDFNQNSATWQAGGSNAFYSSMFTSDRVADEAAGDAAAKRREDARRAADDAASRAADAVKAKWDNFASAVTKALDDASNKARGLFDLGGGGAGGVITEPGKGGPFEALYRITDIAATMAGRAPGADTAKWQEMYAGQDAMGIARNFQQGNLLAPGVFENIDWNMLGQQATQQEQASKISSYAGQAVANLTQAGKPLTAEAVKAEIDKLAEKDKASLVPELQNVAKTVTDTGATAHTDAGDVVLRLDSVISALNKTAPAPTTTTTTTTTTPPVGPPPQTIPLFAAGTAAAPGGMAIVGERGPELVNLPQGARVYTASQTDNILAGLALRGFAAGTSYAPGGMAILGERGPELVQIPGNRQSGGSSGGGSETQVAAQFMTELAKSINTKASTTQQAADALADMLVNAAAVNVQASMLRQLSRR